MRNQNSPVRKANLRCGWCGGSGRDKHSAGKCSVCKGAGTVQKHPDSRRCGSCGGTGEEPHAPGTPVAIHKRCGGSGWIEPG